MSEIGRLLLYAGVGLVVLGGALLFLDRIPGIPFGKLPGDVTWQRGDVRVHAPFATMIVVSILLTLLVNVVLRLLR